MESLKIDLEKLRKDTWTEEEYENAALVLDFVQNIMNDHNFNYVRERFGNHRYKQHNQSMKDGLSGVLKTVSDFTKNYPDFSYDVKHVYVDGGYVTLHSHATAKKKHKRA